MKIAYITMHWPRTKNSSIGKKIIRQINEWRLQGHDVRFFSHLYNTDDKFDLIDGDRFFFDANNGLIQREFGRISAATKLINAVREFTPDIIYLRWGMYTAPIQRIFTIAPVVLEINTNDKKEHRHLGIFLDLYNRLTRSILFKAASGLVFTSFELARDPAFTSFKKPFDVIANGIDLHTIPFYSAPANKPPRLVFLGTPGMAWHGLDELSRFAEMNADIEIDIIGSGPEEISGIIPPNMHLYGYLQGMEFEDMLAKADVAIGTISLFSKGMNEASPFKIRDCAGRGIPCILPYKDTDLSDIQTHAILQIPNAPNNLVSHNQEVHDFIFSMRGKRLKREQIADRIDIVKKEKQRLAFFKQILEQD